MTALAVSLACASVFVYSLGPKAYRLARFLIKQPHPPIEALILYFLLFGLVFFLSFWIIAVVGWFASLFDWGVKVRIDEKGVFCRGVSRETIPWRKIGGYDVEFDDGHYVITFEVQQPEKFLKPPVRLLGIRLFGNTDPGLVSFTTDGLDGIAEHIRDLFELQWEESRAQI